MTSYRPTMTAFLIDTYRGLKNVFWFSGAPDEPRERTKAVLRPHQAPRHLSALLWRQLQRHPEEIQEHGGAGLRLPLTPIPGTNEVGLQVGLATGCYCRSDSWVMLTSTRQQLPVQILSLQGTSTPKDRRHVQFTFSRDGSLIGNFTRRVEPPSFQSLSLLTVEFSLHGSATERMTVCECGEDGVFQFVYYVFMEVCVWILKRLLHRLPNWEGEG